MRDATASQVSDNVEINHIKQILGLQHGRQYLDAKALRYGSLMIMTDQDHDGSHIKGLIMNFLHTFYPSLLKVHGFLVEFITPIVKARPRGGGARAQREGACVFYTMPEYEAWVESLPPPGLAAGWDVKYYKGLGTSSSAEAKEYFARMDSHRKEFVWEGELCVVVRALSFFFLQRQRDFFIASRYFFARSTPPPSSSVRSH